MAIFFPRSTFQTAGFAEDVLALLTLQSVHENPSRLQRRWILDRQGRLAMRWLSAAESGPPRIAPQ